MTSDFQAPTCSDYVADMAVDSTGIYLTGSTDANSFPSPGGSTSAGSQRTFVVKLDPNGSKILYMTFLGSSNGQSVAVDTLGSVYVAGVARIPAVSAITFPTTPGAFSVPPPGACNLVRFVQNGCAIPFAAKLSPDGSSLQYSTLLQTFTPNQQMIKTSETIQPVRVAADSTGALYITGILSLNTIAATPLMPLSTTVGAYQTTRPADSSLFVMKLNSAGSGLAYATYLGGPQGAGEAVAGIAVDSSGSAYMAGSSGPGYPTTPGAYQPTNAGRPPGVTNGEFTDGIVTKLSPDGSSLAYSTFFGGAGK